METTTAIAIVVFLLAVIAGCYLLSRKPKLPDEPTLDERKQTDLDEARKLYYEILLEEDDLSSRKAAAARRIERLSAETSPDWRSHIHMGVQAGPSNTGPILATTGAA